MACRWSSLCALAPSPLVRVLPQALPPPFCSVITHAAICELGLVAFLIKQRESATGWDITRGGLFACGTLKGVSRSRFVHGRRFENLPQLIADANKDDGSLLRCALRGAMFPFPRPHLPPALVHPSPSFRREFLDESGRAG